MVKKIRGKRTAFNKEHKTIPKEENQWCNQYKKRETEPEINPSFDGVRVAKYLVFYVLSCELIFVWFFFSFLTVYFLSMSLTVLWYLSPLFRPSVVMTWE